MVHPRPSNPLVHSIWNSTLTAEEVGRTKAVEEVVKEAQGLAIDLFSTPPTQPNSMCADAWRLSTVLSERGEQVCLPWEQKVLVKAPSREVWEDSVTAVVETLLKSHQTLMTSTLVCSTNFASRTHSLAC